MSQFSYSHDVRMSFCTSCGAPITAPPGGGSIGCSYCNQQANVLPRDESRDIAVAAQPPTLSEAQRFERLRQQDGKPMLPPPNLQHLYQGGAIPPQNLALAQQEWRRAYDELRNGAGFPAEERLYHLTLGLQSVYHQVQQPAQARALVESALDVLKEQRHRQMCHSMLARHAARAGDLQGAEDWLATCTPYSDDLQTDTAWRFGRAFVSTAKGDAQTVLSVLGMRPNDIPIDDSHDAVCAVFRANALERTGQRELAVEQLVALAASIGANNVDQIIAMNNNVQLCPRTWPEARQRAKAMNENVIVSKTGFQFGCLFFPLFIGGFALAGGIAALESLLDPDVFPWALGGLVIGYILMVFVVLGITLGKAAAARKRLRVHGVKASGRVMAQKSTGVRVNNQPQLELSIQVAAPGRDPFIIRHREVVPAQRFLQVQLGSSLPVLFDPNDPALFVIDWP